MASTVLHSLAHMQRIKKCKAYEGVICGGLEVEEDDWNCENER